jgi:hypothetical protein
MLQKKYSRYYFYLYICLSKSKKHILNTLKNNKMRKYKQNLSVIGNNVYSYNTHVATIQGTDLKQLGYWSMTTQKHINFVAKELNLTLIKN